MRGNEALRSCVGEGCSSRSVGALGGTIRAESLPKAACVPAYR
jgi:hypothetical protein